MLLLLLLLFFIIIIIITIIIIYICTYYIHIILVIYVFLQPPQIRLELSIFPASSSSIPSWPVGYGPSGNGKNSLNLLFGRSIGTLRTVSSFGKYEHAPAQKDSLASCQHHGISSISSIPSIPSTSSSSPKQSVTKPKSAGIQNLGSDIDIDWSDWTNGWSKMDGWKVATSNFFK